MSVRLTIRGLQEAQDAINRAEAALAPSGGLGRAVQHVTAGAHRYAVTIAHVDTGAMRAAQRHETRGTRGEVYTDPGAVNPRTKERPADYIRYEEARGGSHAVYTRTVQEAGPKLLEQGTRIVLEEAF